MEKYCSSKSNAFYLDEQLDQEKEDTQKEIVFISNEGSCHAPLPKMRENEVATRVDDVYTRGKHPSIHAKLKVI